MYLYLTGVTPGDEEWRKKGYFTCNYPWEKIVKVIKVNEKIHDVI